MFFIYLFFLPHLYINRDTSLLKNKDIHLKYSFKTTECNFCGFA